MSTTGPSAQLRGVNGSMMAGLFSSPAVLQDSCSSFRRKRLVEAVRLRQLLMLVVLLSGVMGIGACGSTNNSTLAPMGNTTLQITATGLERLIQVRRTRPTSCISRWMSFLYSSNKRFAMRLSSWREPHSFGFMVVEERQAMFLAGLEFGMGFWISTMIFASAAIFIPCFSETGWSVVEPETARIFRSRAGRGLQEALWMSAPEPELRVKDAGPGQRVFVRTVITWGGTDDQEIRRKEPHYRH